MRRLTRMGLFAAALAGASLIGCGGEGQVLTADPDPTPDAQNPTASDAHLMAACGVALASFDGSTAYSNGANTGTGISCGGVGSYGYKYQCVELVMRHFTTHWGLRWYGNAKDLLAGAPRTKVDVYYNGDSAHPPVAGDMLVWTKGTYGHVALITNVQASSVDIIEQNVSGNGRATLTYSNGTFGARWGTWVPAGWAHAKANGNPPPPPPPPPGVNWDCNNSSYAGAQYWTCSGNDRYECQGGTPVKDTCALGCFGAGVGKDDQCIQSGGSWSCSSSNYAGRQYWTCVSGSIYRCSGTTTEKVACPNGCVVHPIGTDDACR